MDDDSSAPPGDRFRALYDGNALALLGYALRRVALPADAADVVAETFLVAWRRLDDVPPGVHSRPWLFGVARRVLANQRRGDLRRNALADRLRQQLTRHIPRDGASASEAPPVVARVREALDHLSEDDRELLRLTTWEGLSPTELAMALGIPPATVRTRLHRARRRLREVLEAQATEEPDGTSGVVRASARGDRSARSERPTRVERSGGGGHVMAGERTLAPDRREEP